MTTKPLHGIINGKTIDLDEDPGVPLGQQVEVVVKTIPTTGAASLDGLRRCAGALATEWSTDDDRILEAIQSERREDSRPDFK